MAKVIEYFQSYTLKYKKEHCTITRSRSFWSKIMIRVWALRRTSNQIVSFWIVVHKFSSLLNKYRVVVASAAFNIQVNTAHYCAIIQ